jgi:hypothetical protein
LEVSDVPVGVQKRAFNARPLNWKAIAEFYGQWGKKKTKAAFSSDFEHRTERSLDQALKQWLVDLRSKRDFTGRQKAPAYGYEIDQKLLCEVKVRMASGLPIDDSTLRMMLMTLLRDNDKGHLLMDNGGDYDLTYNGWASRFCKRHNIASRVATTKMRIIPRNFAVLEEQYFTVAAQMIFDHKVPPDLAYGQDETNAQFVSGPNKTTAEKGSKRIRLGVGAEKPQIIVTFSLKETGEVVGLHQMIFGGKTKRCEPQRSCTCSHLLRPYRESLAEPSDIYDLPGEGCCHNNNSIA